MALSDWVFSGSGTYSIITDGTSPGANTAVIDVLGEVIVRNSSLATGTDRAVEAYLKKPDTLNNEYGLALRHTSTDAYSTGYQLGLTNQSSSTWGLALYKIGFTKSSSTLAPLTGLTTDWQKWRLSVVDSGGIAYIRAELWDGAAYVVVAEFADIAPLVAGHESVFNSSTHLRVDTFKSQNIT